MAEVEHAGRGLRRTATGMVQPTSLSDWKTCSCCAAFRSSRPRRRLQASSRSSDHATPATYRSIRRMRSGRSTTPQRTS